MNIILKKTYLLLILAFVITTVSWAKNSHSSGPAYDFSKLKREKPGRGLIAVRENDSTVNISWRYLSSDPIQTTFDIYRNGQKINTFPLKNSTYFKDKNIPPGSLIYELKAGALEWD